MKRNPSLHTKIAEVIFLAALMISGFALFSAVALAQTVAIMPLGDSITDGAAGSTDDTGYRRSLYLQLTGAGRDVAFVGGLTSGIPLDFDRDHEGHSGWRADQIRDNIYNWLVANPAEIVLLHIGTNDISGGNQDVQEVADILNNIDQYELDNTTSVKVLLARIILRGDSLNPQTIAFNDAVEAMALLRIGAGDDIVLVDQENALTYPADLADPVHPNDSGYGQMADAWFAVLDPILASTGSVAIGSVALAASSPGNLTSDDLTCTYTLFGDATTAATAWFRNGTPEMAFYLPMEGGEPGALLDRSGHAIAASKMDSPTWNAGAGHDGFGAYEFDGNDGLSAGEVFPTNSSYTKCAWVYRTGSGDNGGNNIMSCDEDAGGHAFWAPDARSNHLTAGHTGPSWVGVEDAVPLALNTWYFVAVTYDDASDLMILYKDGAEVDRATVPAVVTDPSLFVGTFGTHGWRWMGTIDDPRVYAHALAPEQIAALFSTGRDLCVAQETVVGDQWQARVTPFSASEVGPTEPSNTITILSGSAPAVENLSLVSASGNDLPTDDLICAYGLTGSATTAATAWTRNGAPLMTLYLPCEGGAANALLDYSGNGYAGAMGTDVTWSATGGHDLNGAFIFGGGSDSQIDMGTVMPAGAYTKCAWVKRQAGAVSYNIISGDNSHAFWAPDNTGYRLAAGHNAGWDNRVVDTGDPLAIDTWYFVAVTFDPAVGAGQMILYKNGSVADSATNVPTHSDDGGRVWIGAFADANAWAGTIDDPRIYPFALSPDQLLEIYTSGNDRISALETSGGEQWQAQVTAFSATEAGATAPTNTLTIQSNTTVANVSLTSTSGSDLTTDDLTVGFDLGGDATTAATAWTRNGAPLMTMYYPFEGGSSRALNDYSGSGHDGIASGDPDALASAGHDGLGCVYLDGNDAIDAGQCLPTGAYTKSAWVRVAAPITANRNILSGHTDHAMWVANYNGGYRLTAGHNHAWNQVEDPVPFVADAWTFVAVTYDPAVGGGTMVLYKDGTEVDSSTGVPPINNNDTRAYVGVYGATTLYMQGHIDDARIFDRALSADQIAALYSGGQTIVAAETGGGEQWQAQVTPFSAGDAGATVPSNTLTIQSAAEVTNVELVSTSGNDYVTDDLTVSYDLSPNASTAATAWTRNGTPLMTMYYPCEGGGGNAFSDYSGSGNHGTAVGDPVWLATGGHDGRGCLELDGNDHVDAGNCKPTGAYSKSAWVYWVEDATTSNNIISGQSSHAFWIADYGGKRLAAGHNGAWDQVQDPALFGAGVWTHVAVTYDPAVDGGTLTLYKNGSAVDASIGIPPSADTRAFVGSFAGGYQFQGRIDDPRIYDRALAPDQINALYTDGNTIVAAETVTGDLWQAQITPFSAVEAGPTVASNTLAIVAPLIAPTITSAAVTTATVDRLYVYNVEAAGYPVPEYAFSGSPPAGMTIDQVTGLIQWMPTEAQVGPQAVEVVASNTEGTDTQAFSVEVAEAPTCPPGMIAYWQLDETGGTSYADSYGTHPAATSLPPTPVTGQVGGAQQFDGSGSTGTNEIRVPAHGDFDWGAGDSFSIEFWLKLAAISTQNDVIVGRDHDGVGNSLHWWTGVQANTGRASWNQIATSGDGTAVTGATNVADGLWHHLAFVRVAGDGNYIYLDGVQDGYAPKASYNAGFDSPTAEINIGWLWIDKKYTYDGSVDEVALYGRALDPAEIGYHHSRGLAGSGYCTASAAPPGVLADLAATQVMSGSPPGGTNSTTAIRLNWTAPADPSAATVEIYRMGFGFYPEYDDGGGSVPTPPAAPGAGGWEHVASLPAGTGEAFDAPASRDFWYYVGYVTDWYGMISDVSPLTSGTLDYFLGDMSDGEDPPGEGNNIVGMDDISLLGTCYGTDDLDPLFKNVADVGPTYDFSVHDRPQTDNLINFDDLIICAVNFGSGLPKQPGQPMEPPAPAERDLLTLQVPPLPDVEQTFAVGLVMSGAGQIQGLSIPLQWNAEVVAPVGVESGPLLQDQGGATTILSPRPGVLDVVLLGARDQGISGEGLLATATFRVLAEGDPQLVLAEISARDHANQAVMVLTQVASGVPEAETLPRMTRLHANVPNPFNPRTTIAFDLAETGRATVKIYGVDGRLVKTLADSEFRPGRYTRIWDGTDESGRGVASGVYLVRLQTPDGTHLRRMLLLR